MTRLTESNTVTEKRGYSSAPAEGGARPKPRVASSFRSSLRGSLKGSMKMKRTPSLIFAQADSESDDLTSCGYTNDDRPRRQCSFVNRGEVPPEIMDLRMLDSEHGSGRRSSYELSVCSTDSFQSMKTGDEKMGMFEVTLPSALKKAVTTAAKMKDGDEDSKGLIDAVTSKNRRTSMETIWSASRRTIAPSNRSPQSDPKDMESIDSSLTKSPRKFNLRRCVQAAAIFVLLAMFVAFPWLVVAIYFGADTSDPSSLISSVTNKILEGLFDPRDEREIQREQGIGEPAFVQPGVNRRRLSMLESPQGDEAMIPQDSEDDPNLEG